MQLALLTAALPLLSSSAAAAPKNVTCCVGWPDAKQPNKRGCEAGGAARHDGGTYLFNAGRGTPNAVCGETLGCDCCRIGPPSKVCKPGHSGKHAPPGPPPAPAPGDAPSVNVFHEKLGNTSCYRIPSIVQTKSGTLVAFAEAREGSCGDAAVHSIAVRRSTDHGKSWGDVSFVKGPSNSMVGNPVAFATKSGKVVLVYVLHSAKCEADCGTGNGVSVSSDDGLTWAPAKDVSKDWGPASGSLPGPGNGVQTTVRRSRLSCLLRFRSVFCGSAHLRLTARPAG